MAQVYYNAKSISDTNIKDVLQRIATHIGSVQVTSGDRNFVPPGGSKTSLHLAKQAVDFYIVGHDLSSAFRQLFNKSRIIFDDSCMYEVIWHGPYTNTGGQHLHIGRYTSGRGVLFKVEGTTPESKGKYSLFC